MTRFKMPFLRELYMSIGRRSEQFLRREICCKGLWTLLKPAMTRDHLLSTSFLVVSTNATTSSMRG